MKERIPTFHNRDFANFHIGPHNPDCKYWERKGRTLPVVTLV